MKERKNYWGKRKWGSTSGTWIFFVLYENDILVPAGSLEGWLNNAYVCDNMLSVNLVRNKVNGV